MEVTATDAARLKVLLTALKRGKYDLEGEEVLAFAQMFHWASELAVRISTALVSEKPKEEIKTVKAVKK